MYARSYYPERDPETGIPKNYGGTALREPPPPEPPMPPPPIEPPPPPPPPPPREERRPEPERTAPEHAECPPNKNPWELPPPKKNHGGGIFDSLFGALPLGGLGNLFPAIGSWFSGEKGGDEGKGFATEDLLILAVAAILFFSKFGDKECALMLLFLLFIK